MYNQILLYLYIYMCVWTVYDTFKSHGDPSVVQFKPVKDAPLAAVGIVIQAQRELCQGSGRIEDLNRCICAANHDIPDIIPSGKLTERPWQLGWIAGVRGSNHKILKLTS